MTPTPPFLEGDDTAFAFYMPEDSIIAGMRGVLLYATKRRDPVEEDCVMFVMKNGSLHVRIIMEIHPDHFSTLRLTSRDSMRSAKEKIKFDQINEMAVIAGTCRISS